MEIKIMRFQNKNNACSSSTRSLPAIAALRRWQAGAQKNTFERKGEY